MPHRLHGWHARKRCDHDQCKINRLDEGWPREFTWVSGILYNQQRPGRQRRPTEGNSLNVMLLWDLALHQTIQGWQAYRSLRYTKRGETKMVRCLDVVLYNLAKVENEKEAVHRRSIQSVPVCMQTQPSSIFSLTLPSSVHFWAIKEKKQLIIFMYQRYCLSLLYNTCNQCHPNFELLLPFSPLMQE